MSSIPLTDHDLVPIEPVTSELLRRRARAAACGGHRRVEAPTDGDPDADASDTRRAGSAPSAADPPHPGGAR